MLCNAPSKQLEVAPSWSWRPSLAPEAQLFLETVGKICRQLRPPETPAKEQQSRRFHRGVNQIYTPLTLIMPAGLKLS